MSVNTRADKSADNSADSQFPHLFSRFQLGPVELKNRIVHASMSTRFAKDGQVTDKLIDYHASRIRGGAAMTITEVLGVLAHQLDPFRVQVLSAKNADGLARWAAAIHAADGHILGQLQDGGRGRHQPGRDHAAIGASGLPDDMSWTVPHAVSTGEAEQLIEQFARSSYLLAQAGFCGVELSAGHGHLIHQFLAGRSNIRQDRFGGDQRQRCQFLVELVQSIRDQCGKGFLIGVKLPGADGMPDGIDLDAAKIVTAELHKTGCADYLTYCWGAHSNTLDWHLPDLHGERAPYVEDIVELAKSAPGVAVGALGLITDPHEGERVISKGQADLVMLGRALVTDPAWGLKAQTGREAEIRYCVSCNSCWGAIINGKGLCCDNNPTVGLANEADWMPDKTERRKKVVIVGAGIAGLEAAWTSAARGHDVCVFTTAEEVGGKTRLHSLLPGGEHLSSIFDYQVLMADRFGVSWLRGPKATASQIMALEPDTVVLATGSTPDWPAYLPEEYRDTEWFPDIRTVAAQMVNRKDKTNGTAVIFDIDHSAFVYATAELLVERFTRVVLVTPRESLAQEEPKVNRLGINRRIYSKGVEVITWSQPVWTDDIENGALMVEHVLTGALQRIDDVALLTHATSRIANDQLAAQLLALGIEAQLIGDCFAPRSVMAATAEGHQLGKSL